MLLLKLTAKRHAFCLACLALALGGMMLGLALGPGFGLLAPEASQAAEDAAPAPAFSPPAIQVHPGFEVSVAAAPGMVQHPTMAAFDDRGRLFVAETAGLNLRAADLLEQLPNYIRMLEDTNGDGVFDRSTIFADKMTFPMGALWHQGALYVASPPYIWRLEDTTGDGVADKRQILVEKFGFTGNAADVHGCFLGPNGRIYWCDGRHGHEFTDAEGNISSKGLAARVFSCRADGSDVQVFAGGGMDNPVEVTFAPTGEMFGTMTFYNPDQARHDALVHFAYGGVYPKIHPCLSEFKRTGDLMPALSKFGVTAPSGLARYRGPMFGAAYRNNLFSVQFNTHKVLRHKLTRDGATFRCEDEDFLVCESPDFHPTDVLEDADGSLLVIDTGGWFRIGCPTSQVAKPEIPGAIYRVRYVGLPGEPASAPSADLANQGSAADPRGHRLPWDRFDAEELVKLLASPWPAVRDRAQEKLIAGANEATVKVLAAQLDEAASHDLRRRAVWTLSRIEQPHLRSAAWAAVRQALTDPHEDVRQVAARSVGVLGDRDAIATLARLAKGELIARPGGVRAPAPSGEPSSAQPEVEYPQVRAAAAAALGQLRAAEAVPSLLAGLKQSNDRFVEHALIYALIEINHREPTLAGLADPNPTVKRGALIALDQMDDGNLTQQMVGGLLDTSDADLQKTALEIIAGHEGWGEEIVGLMQTWLADQQPLGERAAMARGVLQAFQGDAAIQQLIAEQLQRGALDRKRLMLDVLARSERTKAQEVPAAWREALERLLASDQLAELEPAVATVAANGWPGFDLQLRKIAGQAKLPQPVRLAAVVAVARQQLPLSADEFELLQRQIQGETAPLDRLAAAEGLASAKLSLAQQQALAEQLRLAGPLEMPALLTAFEQCGDVAVGQTVVASLTAAPGLSSVTPQALERALANFPADVRRAAAGIPLPSQANRAEQLARLQQFERHLEGGLPELGKAVFQSKKAACTACHRVAGEGGTVGPDLSKIGEVRTPRDLLEAVLFPSVSFARGYESYAVLTADGHGYIGVVQRETPDAIYLRSADRAEIRIARANIEEMLPSNISIMPAGLEQTMSTDDLKHLVAYLRSLK